ncbi:hypothetical protein KIF59_04150 [Enterobacter cloacae subsp. cloacae]|nr:hypothetical protein [Enterobacter cloacae subsp. cloacae]
MSRLLRMVGLLPDHESYYPHMLALGQKRLAGARADFAPEGDYSRTKPSPRLICPCARS